MFLISCDHAGLMLTVKIVKKLDKLGVKYSYLGPQTYEKLDSYVDYACKAIKQYKENDKILLICSSGVGMSIVANKHKNIRAVLGYNVNVVKKAVQHNNVNCLCLGQNFVSLSKALKMIKVFLNCKFENGRHLERVNKINQLI